MPIIMLSRREVFRGAAMLATMSATGSARAQTKFFRIGTGGTGGTYYPVGGMVANAISSEKLNVSAVSTAGSVANINGIIGGSMESGFSQADVNSWAFTGLFAGRRELLGPHGYRALRGQAEGGGVACHLPFVPGACAHHNA